jgi:hypothetical protein
MHHLDSTPRSHELMDATHLILYPYENGLEILRHGRITARNGIIARERYEERSVATVKPSIPSPQRAIIGS